MEFFVAALGVEPTLEKFGLSNLERHPKVGSPRRLDYSLEQDCSLLGTSPTVGNARLRDVWLTAAQQIVPVTAQLLGFVPDVLRGCPRTRCEVECHFELRLLSISSGGKLALQKGGERRAATVG